jgi:FkbM family methyltransferase
MDRLIKILKPIVEKFPVIAECYRHIRDAKRLNASIEFREKLGFFFNGDWATENGEFEPLETVIIENLLDSVEIFINIGANYGYYVCKALKGGVETIAFEPNQHNVNMMLKNVHANRFDAKFQLFPVALSDELGILPMYGSSTGASLIKGWAGQLNSYLVATSTFDKTAKSLTEGKQCLILIDIEGAEYNCLKGAMSLLCSKSKNIFLIEITVAEHQPDGKLINPDLFNIFSMMADHGYNAYTADCKLRKIELSEVFNIESTLIDTLGVHNFLFVKQDEILRQIEFH